MDLREGREALHTAVTALLSGNGIQAGDIKAYRTANFGPNPTHCIMGTLRLAADAAGTLSEAEPGFYYFIQLLARYSDEASQEAAEDALDDLTQLLADGLVEHVVGDEWETLDILGSPDRTAVRYGSSHYLVQQFNVLLTSR